jgi:mannan endo-1,4-beta-mannosidase
MHVTLPRVLGFLLFCALIGYAFVVGPRVSPLPLRSAGTTSTYEHLPVLYPARPTGKPARGPGAPFPASGRQFIGLLTGEGSADLPSVDRFVGATQVMPQALEFTVSGTRDPFEASSFDSIEERGMFPIVSWNPWGPAGGSSAAAVLRGDFDTYITSYAKGIKKLGYPVGLQFSHEAGGGRRAGADVVDDTTAAQSVAVWRYVHDIFQRAGATNATWIWSPDVSLEDPSTPLEASYPGDDYVDWVGLEACPCSVHASDFDSFDEIFDTALARIRQLTAEPLMVTETGSAVTEGTQAPWITHLFHNLALQKDVVGVIWNEAAGRGKDWRITSHQASIAAFKAATAGPRYRWSWSPDMKPTATVTLPTPAPSGEAGPVPQPLASGTPSRAPAARTE